jgi:TolB-like protein/Tfp pilus assembly protein PilF
VLPLANLSGNPQEDYFADVITEQLITDLARVGQLRVTSTTSAMLYKGAKKPLPEIAHELGTDMVVEGSIVRSGPSFRLTIKLVDGAQGQVIWADTYERDMRDVLALQREIARTVARRIQIELSSEDRARLEGGGRIEPEAYEACVRGRYLWNKRGQANLQKAVEQFQQALDVDPTYAAAYSGMADCYGQLGYGAYVSPEDSFPRARGAAQKALELDPTLADAHASLGYALMYYDWKFAEAEAEYKRAIALNPSYSTAHQWYAYLLMAMERPVHDMEREIALAKSLDPLSVAVSTDRAYMLYYTGKVDEALKAVRTALDMNPKFPLGYAIAVIYAGLGDRDQTFQYLEAAFRERSHWLVWLKRDPRWDGVHSDARFQDLVRRVGLPS